MASTDIFDRIVELTAGLPRTAGKRWRTKGEPLLRENGALRIAFAVKLTSSRKPNKAQVELYNLEEDSIALLQQPGAIASLRAGYRQASDVIAAGNIITATKKKTGDTTVMSVSIGDGEILYLTSRFDKSYSGPAQNTQILADIISQMGIGRGFVDQLPPRTYPSGMVFYGCAREALDLVLGDVGAEWSIQEGALQVLCGNDIPISRRVILLTPRTGLKQVEKKKNGVEIISYMNGRIWPGREIRLESEELTGDFVARVVDHVGDGFDASSAFETRIQARRLQIL